MWCRCGSLIKSKAGPSDSFRCLFFHALPQVYLDLGVRETQLTLHLDPYPSRTFKLLTVYER
jgi:hypothetical protein